MNRSELIEQWKKDEQAIFEGWDFSYLKERLITEKEPWNYVEIAKMLVKKHSENVRISKLKT